MMNMTKNLLLAVVALGVISGSAFAVSPDSETLTNDALLANHADDAHKNDKEQHDKMDKEHKNDKHDEHGKNDHHDDHAHDKDKDHHPAHH